MKYIFTIGCCVAGQALLEVPSSNGDLALWLQHTIGLAIIYFSGFTFSQLK